MNNSANRTIEVFLQPGECFVGDKDYTLRTLLGSCVSITLWHPKRRIGAMSHFLLPSRKEKITELDGYYGEEAMLLMLRELVRAKVSPVECEAKIFGGGNMFPMQTKDIKTTIGMQNGELARRMLKMHHIPVKYEDLFGIGHRQISFNIKDGNVLVRHVKLVDVSQQHKEAST